MVSKLFSSCYFSGLLKFFNHTVFVFITRDLSSLSLDIKWFSRYLATPIYLRVVFQNDSNIHVDNNQETKDKIHNNIYGSSIVTSTVACFTKLLIWCITIFIICNSHVSFCPTSRCTNLIKKRKISRILCG